MLRKPLRIPAGATISCDRGTMNEDGVIIYSCDMPDGGKKEFDRITVWDARTVEVLDKGIRIRASKNMSCGVTRGKTKYSDELICPPTT